MEESEESEESDVSSLLSKFDASEEDESSDDDDFLSKLDIQGIDNNTALRAENFLKQVFEEINRRIVSDEKLEINFESKYKIE